MMSNQEILATVAGEQITEKDLKTFIQNLPKEQQMYAANPQFRQQVLDQMINNRLFAKYAEEIKLDETDDFKEILNNVTKEILANMAIGETLKNIEVSEEEMKAFYEENPQHFQKGASVSAKHILVKDEAKCREILEMITSGAKVFEEAAQEFSTCPSGQKGGDLGEFGKGQMVKEFEDAAFSAEIGQVVGPVATQFGYHLIKVEARKDAETIAFEEVKEQIRRNLLSQKQNQAYSAKAAELKAKYM